MEVDSSDGQKWQHLYMTGDLASIHDRGIHETDDMAQKGKQYNPKKIVHASDGEAWSHIDAIHHEKAEEARNVRVVLATDGFNPYGLMDTPYTCWPVFIIPFNMSPLSVCFQRHNIFLWLIILGHRGNKIGVYIEHIWATIMDIPNKSKDNVKARVDLIALCDGPNQDMKPPSSGNT
jgi:hypothetical protein